MANITKLIEEVEDSLYSSETDIIECLKKTRIIARYYNDVDIEKWITNELIGYKEVNEDFPNYRKIPATVYSSHVEINRFVGYKRKFDQYHGTVDYPYDAPIYDIIKRSKKDDIKLTILMEEKQIPILIRGIDLQSIITKVNLKLTDFIQEKVEEISKRPYETPLMRIFNNFHLVAKSLEDRHDNRSTIVINDEYDTQDLLNALLQIEFGIIKKEEYNPSFVNKNSRIDFFLRLENIGIEVKKVRDKAHAKNLSDEIIDDKAKYSNNKDITELYFFIYDPNTYLLNREEFILDLERDMPKQFDKVKIIIKPEL